MATLSDVLHTFADHLTLPTGHDREQLHEHIDSALEHHGLAVAAEPPALDMEKPADPAAATTAYGPGALPTIQGGPYAAPVAPGSPFPAAPLLQPQVD